MSENLPANDHDLLIRIDTKVDSFLNGQADHEIRLRTLEADHEKTKGVIDTFKGLITFIGLLATASATLAAWATFWKG